MSEVRLVLEWFEKDGDDLVGRSAHIKVDESAFEAAFGLESGQARKGLFLVTPSTVEWINDQFGVCCDLAQCDYFAGYESVSKE